MSTRTVAEQHPAYRDDIADLTTRRPLPGPGVEQIDPFLFLNHHGPQVYGPGNAGLPFGPHPHRGFETVTFIVEGTLAHHDTGGHESVIEAGGVQWMTAGSGLIHAEISPPSFRKTGGPLEILQLWVNLPSRLKMTAPRYTGVQADQIPVVPIAGSPIAGVRAKLNLISGSFEDDVECRLLLFLNSSTGSGASNSNSSSGNFEGLFEELDELRELDDGQFLESFNELFVGELRHGVASFL